MAEQSRRKFFQLGIASGMFGFITNFKADEKEVKLPKTPKETKGPFYPITPQKDKDFDLTQIEGNKEVAKGKTIVIEGVVVDTDGKIVEDASVEIWQANAAGRYAHPHDTNKAPLDENFQGWAIVPSGKEGTFKFKTILPGAYPAGKDWMRPPHIHFKITKLGYIELITQMYFPDHELNAKDRLIMRKTPEEQKLMIAQKPKADEELYKFQIVLEKA